MRLILEYQTASYTWWASETLPVEYESEEALLCDFETELDAAISQSKFSFNFVGHEFMTDYFFSQENKIKSLPEITNLDH